MLAGQRAIAEADPSPPFEVLRLDNGLELVLVERPGSAEVAAGWVVPCGAVDDPIAYPGTAHLLEHLFFHGTETLGTTDFERETAILEELRRRGPDAPSASRREHLEGELAALWVPQEIDRQYARAGGSNLNAFTMEDLTAYFVTLPANKLELWFWIESDRLRAPVFRHRQRELAVVEQERQARLAAPGGRHLDLFHALAWQGHPYGRSNLGRGDRLAALDDSQLQRHRRLHYRPDRITAILVGAFDRQQVERWAQAYFGRLTVPPSPLPETPPKAADTPGAVRLTAQHKAPAAIRARYRSVPFGHPDSGATELLVDLLNGPDGWLERHLVEPGLALQASAEAELLRHGGGVTILAIAPPGASADGLEKALLGGLEGQLPQALATADLEAAKNRLRWRTYRRLQEPLRLLIELLIHAGKGDVGELFRRYERIIDVSPQDLTTLAERIFQAEGRTLGVLTPTSAGTP